MTSLLHAAYRLVSCLLAPGLPPRDRLELAATVEARLARAGGLHRQIGILAFELVDLARNSASSVARRLGSLSLLDLKIGVRLLFRQPGLSLVALVTLTVGIPIGVGPLHAVRAFEAPPTVPGGEDLVVLKSYDSAAQRWARSNLYDYLTWQQGLHSVTDIGAAASEMFNLTGGEEGNEAARGAMVTANLFEAFPTPPLLGRVLQPDDEREGAAEVAVIGHDLWQSRFGADSDIVGRSISIGGRTHVIVGVMPEAFHYPARESLWLPLRVNPATASPGTGRSVLVFGRLAGAADLAAARAEIAGIGERTATLAPRTHEHLRADVLPYTIGLYPLPRGGLSADPGFYFFQILTIAVLVVVCSNIGMLMLARTASRAEELAVRTALGASRGRIVAQLFSESLVLAVLAASVGLVIADAIVERSLGWLSGQVPAWIDFGINPGTTALALGLAVLSAAVVGVVPALKLTGGNVHANIQSAAAGRAGVRFGGLSSALIVADIALAMLVVAGATVAWDTQPGGGLGLDAEQYLTASIYVPSTVPGEDIAAFEPDELAARVAATRNALAQQLEAEPGIGAPAFTSHVPGAEHARRTIELEGHDLGASPDESALPRVRVAAVDREFFAALEHPIVQGRGFLAADLDDESRPVIVNTRFVEGVLQGQSALGRRLRFAGRSGDEPGPWQEIVGVVGDLGMDTDNPEDAWGVYRLLPRDELNPAQFVVRVNGPSGDAAPRLRALVAATDSTAILSTPVPLSEIFNFDSYIIGWVSTGVLAFIGAVLVLSAMSLYALMSFTVTQRTREVGIRIALGAGRSGIARTVVRRAAAQLLLGFVIGAPIALAVFIRADIATNRLAAALAIDVVALALVATAACLAPTLRALRIDPTEALRDGA